MPVPLPLDPDKFCRDVEARAAERLRGSGLGGRPRTGTMATVRQHLSTIMALREGGATWPDLAAALMAQGITRGDGGPFTGRHLSALIASIRRQDASRASARARTQARRTARADLSHASEAIPTIVLPQTAVSSYRNAVVDLADDASEVDHNPGSPEALFQRLDRKARQAAEAAAGKPDFSQGLIGSAKQNP